MTPLGSEFKLWKELGYSVKKEAGRFATSFVVSKGGEKIHIAEIYQKKLTIFKDNMKVRRAMVKHSLPYGKAYPACYGDYDVEDVLDTWAKEREQFKKMTKLQMFKILRENGDV